MSLTLVEDYEETGPYTLEIWRSFGGVFAFDFTLQETFPGFVPGTPYRLVDAPVIAGQLYAYKSRYVPTDPDDAANPASDWSNIAFARAPYPLSDSKGLHMGCAVTSARTQVGLGVERYLGQNVQAAYGLDAISTDIAAQVNRAESSANRNTVAAISDETAAASSVSGSLSWDLRANGGSPRAMLAGYEIASTTTIASAGSVPEHYIHKLVAGFNDHPITIVDKQGDSAFVLAGAELNTLTINGDKTQTTPIRADGSFMGLNYLVYPAATNNDLILTGLAALAYDVTKFGPTDWAMYIAGTMSPDARSFGFTLNRNLQEKQVGDYRLGPQCHYPDKSTVQSTGNLYWNSLDEIRRYFGVTDNTLLMFGITKTILTTEVRIVFLPPANASGYINKLELVLPVASVRSLLKPVPESGAIMQDITFQPRQDASDAFRDHYWLLTTGETAAALTAPQPEMPVAPKADFSVYTAVPGVVTGSPTTTVIASAASPFLTAPDDGYNGLYLQFTTGARAGERQIITDYVASTRTFTVGVAFTGAPSAGDKFIVVGGFGIE